MMSFAAVLSELEEKGEINPEEWVDFDSGELYKAAQRENVPWKKASNHPIIL